MKQPNQDNLAQVIRVALALQKLREKVVFIGGAIVGILITDPGAPAVRSTKDVDAIIEVAGLAAQAEMESELQKLGFKHDISSAGHMLRWSLGDSIVDFLPPDASLFGMTTSWYPLSVECSVLHAVLPDLNIRVISAPLFICTKFDAHDDRGQGNLHESKDIGDILAVIEGREELLQDVSVAPQVAKSFIVQRFNELLEHKSFEDCLQWHIYDDRRHSLVLDRMRDITELP